MQNESLIYGIDDKPPLGVAIALGFQHYLTMFGSTVAIPLILAEPLGLADHPVKLGWLIGTMFFVSGITTLLQTSIGNRLPLIQGGTFSFLTPAITICGMASLAEAGFEMRMQYIQGAVIAGALFEIVIGYTGLVGRLLHLVGPITIAPTIALIGLCLFQVGAQTAGTHWGIAGLTIGLIVLFSQYLRKRHRAFELFPIMLAILIAWAVAGALSITGVFAGPVLDAAGNQIAAAHPAFVSSANLADAPWFRVPRPFQWGWPEFAPAAMVGMLAGYIASIVESVGDYYACARLSGAPVPGPKVINKGIGMEGIGCLIAGIFGTGNGTTSYSENIGAIGLTRVGSRRVVQAGAWIMIFLACVGKFGAAFTMIPKPIVGGMYCAMFGMIAAVGLSNLQYVNLNSARNLFILGFSFFMGLAVPSYFAANPLVAPEAWGVAGRTLVGIGNTVGMTGMAVGAFIAMFLDNTIPGTDEERGLTAWARHGE